MATPRHNLAALCLGTSEFSFSEGATSVADTLLKGWLDFGNCNAYAPKKNIEEQVHKGAYRGIRRTDKVTQTSAELTYTLKFDELNKKIAQLLYGAADGTSLTQVIKTAANGDAWAFSSGAGASGTQKWYDVKFSGQRWGNLTSVTIATLTEGTDFEVDLVLGRVRFLVSQTASCLPVTTSAAITAADTAYMLRMTPLADLVLSGYGRIVFWDQETPRNKVGDHVDFSCDVTVTQAPEMNGQNFGEIEVMVRVTSDVGNFDLRLANNN